MKIIRKYGNRRLYDTASKRYVNLGEIAQMLRDGDDIQVLDVKTGEDLTRSILTQIIVENARNRNGGLPLEILRELVSLSDLSKHDGLTSWLHSAFDAYRRAQQAPIELMRTLFSARPHDAGQIEELRRRVDELERQLSSSSGADAR